MEPQKVVVGTVTHSSGGQVHNSLRDVEFLADELGSHDEPQLNPSGSPTRGAFLTLYRTPEARFIVHVRTWSHWQGETNSYRLHHVKQTDLQVGGKFEDLGDACGFGRPLTLDEAIEDPD